MDMKVEFERRVEAICKEVKRLLLEEGQYSHGIEIRVNMTIDEVDRISFEVFEKVKFDGKCID